MALKRKAPSQKKTENLDTEDFTNNTHSDSTHVNEDELTTLLEEIQEIEITKDDLNLVSSLEKEIDDLPPQNKFDFNNEEIVPIDLSHLETNIQETQPQKNPKPKVEDNTGIIDILVEDTVTKKQEEQEKLKEKETDIPIPETANYTPTPTITEKIEEDLPPSIPSINLPPEEIITPPTPYTESLEKDSLSQKKTNQFDQQQSGKDLSIIEDNDFKELLIYLDELLSSLPQEKITAFAHSKHYETYLKLFKQLEN